MAMVRKRHVGDSIASAPAVSVAFGARRFVVVGALVCVSACCDGDPRRSTSDPGRDTTHVRDASTGISRASQSTAERGREIQVRLPPLSGDSMAETAELRVVLEESRFSPIRGAVVFAGDELLGHTEPGRVSVFRVALAPEGLQRIEVDGVPVLADVRAGVQLSLTNGVDTDWHVALYGVGPHSAGSDVAYCVPRNGPACRKGYRSAPAGTDDPLCADVESRDKQRCVRAPTVRVRGPLDEPVEVSPVSLDGRFGDIGAHVLKAGSIEGTSPELSLFSSGTGHVQVLIGDSAALLVMEPGARWEVWRAPDGAVSGRVLARER